MRAVSARVVLPLVVVALGGACTRDGADTPASSMAAVTTAVASPTTQVDTAPVTTSSADLVEVVDVTDGDTLVVELPGGPAVVRLVGVNTPESGECLADQATDELDRLTAGGLVRLVRDESRAAGRGLWASDACGAPAVGGADIRIEVEPDPPGDDTLDLNGEWVRFTNAGSTALDLTAWEVADESASNRYRFAALTLPPGGAVTLFSGCGTDTDTERFWCSERSAIWNNAGDTVVLRDRNGSTVASLGYRP